MANSKSDTQQNVSKSDPTLQHQQPEHPAPGTTQAVPAAGPVAGPPITNVNTTPDNASGTGGETEDRARAADRKRRDQEQSDAEAARIRAAGAEDQSKAGPGKGGQQLTDAQRADEEKAARARREESSRRSDLAHRAELAKRKAEESRHAADRASEEARRLAAKASADAEEAQRLATAADPEKAVFVVAEGKSLFTLSGTKGAFDRVKARDFANGYDELQEHVRAGSVVQRD